MSSRRVAACVITGFLGSGKTTLLRGLLEREPGRERIAVIVNELGEIGIDGRVLTGFEFVENVVEFASGCVCCSIDEYRFDLAVEELVRRIDPVLVVLETTGVADPAPTLERLRRAGLGVDAVVCVVDARAWRVAWRVSATARRQIAAADFLVITKSDLVTARALAKLRDSLRRRAPRALVLEAVAGQPFDGADLLLATSAARRAAEVASATERPGDGFATALAVAPAGLSVPRLGTVALLGAGVGTVPTVIAAAGPSTDPAVIAAAGPRIDPAAFSAAGSKTDQAATPHLLEDGIESFSWRWSGGVDRSAFENVLRSLPPSVLRAKGLLRSPGERVAWLFHLVCGRLEMDAIVGGDSVAVGVQAVFLGPGVVALREGILARFHSCRLPPD